MHPGLWRDFAVPKRYIDRLFLANALEIINHRYPQSAKELASAKGLASEAFSRVWNVRSAKLIETTVSLYAAYYTDDELKGTLRFLQSPIGVSERKKSGALYAAIASTQYSLFADLGSAFSAEIKRMKEDCDRAPESSSLCHGLESPSS